MSWLYIPLESIWHHAQELGIPMDEVEVHVGIEMPQIPCCMAWMHWYTVIKEPMPTDVAVIISSEEQWMTPERRLAVEHIAQAIALAVRSFLSTMVSSSQMISYGTAIAERASRDRYSPAKGTVCLWNLQCA